VTDLPRSRPTEQGVDPTALLRLLDALDADDRLELHGLVVVRHGHVVAEGWWAPYTPERPHLVYSISKSFAMTAVLLAQAEGVLDLDDTVLSHFPELDADATDPRSRATTLRHLASMASGHAQDLQGLLDRYADEPVRALLATPPDADPGTLFAYNQLCTYTLAAALQRVTGQRLTEYLRPRLFDPLGIGEVSWQDHPAGRELGYTGLHARTEDLAKLGQLYLQRGRWRDRQLLDDTLVEEATRKHVDNREQQENVDWQQGYGWQFWIARHGYRGDGAFGQFCVVLPEQDTVLAITGCTEAMQAVLDETWTHLLPGLLPAGEVADAAAEGELAERLAGLSLPPRGGSVGQAGSWTLTVTPAPRVELTSVGLSSSDAGVELTLADRRTEVTVPVGRGGWAVSEPLDAAGDPLPLGVSGGWEDDGRFRAEVLFLETPHRLDLLLDVEAGTAAASWRRLPLGSTRLADLHRPHPR
jgi:CubicO group peptidase (beta-lactamase class C family)